jgi:hypothetical protein
MLFCDRRVVTVGLAGCTVKSSQLLWALLLLESPLKVAFHANVPVLLSVTSRDAGTLPVFSLTFTMEMMLEGPVHMPVGNRLYVTVPMIVLNGVPVAGPKNPLVIVAVSLAVVPTTTVVDDRAVEILGVALLTVRFAHELAAWS